jgi:hypothetical protein
MKFYVSAKWTEYELVGRIQLLLQQNGHEITEDWTQRAFKRNYDEYTNSGDHASDEIHAIRNADVVLHLSDGDGKGKYADVGAACMAFELQRKPSLYVLGVSANESQFYFHPAATRILTVDVLETVRNLLDEDFRFV